MEVHMFELVKIDAYDRHTARGSFCFFIKKSSRGRRPAMKFYSTPEMALRSYAYQMIGHMNGIGPKPGKLIRSLDDWYGFTTEQVVVKQISERQWVELTNRLHQCLLQLEPGEKNSGYKWRRRTKNRKLVQLDFDADYGWMRKPCTK